ncbi:peptidoglycan recognition protein family protein [Streptomyces sp. 4N124]|uniref:peptidoglycan recognition protein family protein n=1 Tax=Streptomyces sp. 4N124 TaxID=3457420 RepID=UPI003FD1AD30
MSIDIRPRSTWAPYAATTTTGGLLIARKAWADFYGDYEKATKELIDEVGASPERSSRTWSPWQGGVFIHHRGAGSSGLDTEEECAKDVADAWSDMYGKADGDIGYNYFVCPHGKIYEGRGLERGEANGGDAPAQGNVPKGHVWVADHGAVGRNAAFYSICGLLRSEDEPTSAMRTSIKNLIAYLRTDVPAGKKAGPNMFPHSKGYDTECPGNLLPYAQTGSLMDPGIPAASNPTQLQIISRAQWGARPPVSEAKVPLSQRTGFTVHYSAGPTSQTPRAIQNYHMDSNGWWDIGYNFLVDVHGRIFEGRGWANEGAHAKGYNTTHFGVCFIGRDGDATTAAKNAIRSLYHAAREKTGKALAATYHGALNSTQCPGAALRAWVQSGLPGTTYPIVGGEPVYDGDPPDDGSSGGLTTVRSIASQQRAVNGLGYTPPLTVDGVFGPLTDAGVRWLQNKVGAQADGLWGPLTEAAYVAYTGEGGSGGGLSTIRSIASQQHAVNALGYTPPLVVDGDFGPLTDAGVRWLQNKVGTEADGLWGTATEAAYVAHIGGSPGHMGGGLTTVRSVSSQQSAVNALGYTPPLDVDGVFGPRTEAGVRWLQDKVGTGVDGLWGPATEAAYGRYADGEQLVVDGEFGPATIAATQRAIGVTADGVWGPESKRALQQHLNTWADAGLIVDGDVGQATVKALQGHLNKMIRAGLTVDGDWGAATTKALQNALNQGRL